ncbi:hypothetical protein [Sulfitobacter sp. 1A12157]|uniref:hypothetical protein n=1 Tax=Sulfitobacter sp. 1A12157 TaxID=3368594 RepID=UPI0037458820
MHWFVLVALFTTPADLSPHVIDGYEPRTFATLAECEKTRAGMTKFLNERVTDPRMKYNVFCVRVSVDGYLEGVANLRRMTGEAS